MGEGNLFPRPPPALWVILSLCLVGVGVLTGWSSVDRSCILLGWDACACLHFLRLVLRPRESM